MRKLNKKRAQRILSKDVPLEMTWAISRDELDRLSDDIRNSDILWDTYVVPWVSRVEKKLGRKPIIESEISFGSYITGDVLLKARVVE